MKNGDKVLMDGQEWVCVGSSDDITPEQQHHARRVARTYMDWAGIPPVTEVLLSVEPYSSAELDKMDD